MGQRSKGLSLRVCGSPYELRSYGIYAKDVGQNWNSTCSRPFQNLSRTFKENIIIMIRKWWWPYGYHSLNTVFRLGEWAGREWILLVSRSMLRHSDFNVVFHEENLHGSIEVVQEAVWDALWRVTIRRIALLIFERDSLCRYQFFRRPMSKVESAIDCHWRMSVSLSLWTLKRVLVFLLIWWRS